MSKPYKIIYRNASVVFYEINSKYYRLGSMQVSLYGDRAQIYGLHGKGIIPCFSEHGVDIMKDLGINLLEGYVSPNIAKAIKFGLRRTQELQVVVGPIRLVLLNPEDIEPSDVHWIEIHLVA